MLDSTIGLVAGEVYWIWLDDPINTNNTCVAEEIIIEDVAAGVQLNFHYGYLYEMYDEYVDLLGAKTVVAVVDRSYSGNANLMIYGTKETRVHKLDPKYIDIPEDLDGARNAFELADSHALVLGDINEYEHMDSSMGVSYRVSDNAYTYEELSDGVSITYKNDITGLVTITCDAACIANLGSGVVKGNHPVSEDVAIFMSISNDIVDSELNIKKGFYVYTLDDGASVPVEISINGRTIQSNKLKEEFLPEEVNIAADIANACFENVGTDTITWDGDLSKIESDELMEALGFYHVSDIVPRISELSNGGTVVVKSFDTGEIAATVFNSDSIGTYGNTRITTINTEKVSTAGTGPTIMIIPYDNEYVGGTVDEPIIFKKKGIYFLNNGKDYVSSLTIDGYTFPSYKLKEEVHTHNEATQSTAGLLSAEDKKQLDLGGIPIVTTEGTGSAYTATVDGLTELTVGAKITIIPHVVSAAYAPTLNVNGLGAKAIRMPVTYNTTSSSNGPTTTWIAANKPVVVEFDGSYWKTISVPRPSAQYLYGAVPIANGGTGGTTVEAALNNLSIGSLANLKTTAKTSIVDAINELYDLITSLNQ